MEVNSTSAPAVLAVNAGISSRRPSATGGSAPSETDTALSPPSIPTPRERQAVSRNPIESITVRQEFPPNTRLHLDEESNRIVAQILDENNEVVRQLPPQELLDISARFNKLQGILFDEQR